MKATYAILVLALAGSMFLSGCGEGLLDPMLSRSLDVDYVRVFQQR